MSDAVRFRSASVRMQERLHARDARSMQRIIVKQGYLRKLPSGSKLGALFKKAERKWFVFGVISNSYPYLEYYESEESIFTHAPQNTYFLDACLYLTRNQRTSRFTNVFTVVLKERKLSLIADTRDQMSEWCRAIEDKLRSLNIIDTTGGNNDYIKVPAQNARRHNSAPGAVRSRNTETIANSTSPAAAAAANYDSSNVAGGRTDTSVYEMLRTDESSSAAAPRFIENPYSVPVMDALIAARERDGYVSPASLSYPPSSSSRQQDYEIQVVANETAVSSTDVLSRGRPRTSSARQQENSMTSSSRLDDKMTSSSRRVGDYSNGVDVPLSPRYVGSSTSAVPTSAGAAMDMSPSSFRSGSSPVYDAATSETGASVAVAKPASNRLPSYSESLQGEADDYAGSPAAFDLQPPAYRLGPALELNANSPLRFRQVQELRDDIARTNGVTVVLKSSECSSSLALVDAFNSVWIAGWNRRSNPLFASKFHVGDQLVSINGQLIDSAKTANSILRYLDGTDDDAVLLIRRLPHAVVVLVKKNADSYFNLLGIEIVGGTAEIGYVDPNGLAAQCGLPCHPPVLDYSDTSCNWWITEVNNQTLNLFYRNSEVTHRLNAAGTHLSFVVQPSQLIIEFKRRLKTIKYFKDYLIE